MFRNRVPILPAALGALLILAGAAWFFTTRPATQQPTAGSSKNRPPVEATSTSGQPLPAYRLADLSQQELSPDELRHGRVLLVFLTTSCEACIKDLDVVTRLNHDAPSDLRVYGVGIERPAQIETFVKEFDLKFPVLVDMGAQLARSLDIHYFPSKYLVKDGVITKIWRGATQDEAELRQQLDIR
ncbi:MAG: TlpA disulfide reductase family protein [Pyrinomonadaceae bacterium]